MEYKVYLNQGNDYIGSEQSISVNENLRQASDRLLAREIHHLNPLIPEEVAYAVLQHLCKASAELMNQGYAVSLKYDGETAVRFYGDIKIKGGNINLERAKQLNPTVTELTTENAGDLVSRAGVVVRAKAETENKFTDLLLSIGESVTRVDVVERARIERTTDTSTNTVDVSTGSGDNGGDDLPPGNG